MWRDAQERGVGELTTGWGVVGGVDSVEATLSLRQKVFVKRVRVEGLVELESAWLQWLEPCPWPWFWSRVPVKASWCPCPFSGI